LIAIVIIFSVGILTLIGRIKRHNYRLNGIDNSRRHFP
jgi:hypothetical protein